MTLSKSLDIEHKILIGRKLDVASYDGLFCFGRIWTLAIRQFKGK